MPRAGHIPEARSVPFHSLLDEQRRFKPESVLRQLFGVSRGAVATYCHIGQQATVPYFAARYLGLDARLYDGSFQDWSSKPGLPVATGAAAGIQ
jgi:thiosulfate/3-mercaptopyruvate sulfurtransferase